MNWDSVLLIIASLVCEFPRKNAVVLQESQPYICLDTEEVFPHNFEDVLTKQFFLVQDSPQHRKYILRQYWLTRLEKISINSSSDVRSVSVAMNDAVRTCPRYLQTTNRLVSIIRKNTCQELRLSIFLRGSGYKTKITVRDRLCPFTIFDWKTFFMRRLRRTNVCSMATRQNTLGYCCSSMVGVNFHECMVMDAKRRWDIDCDQALWNFGIDAIETQLQIRRNKCCPYKGDARYSCYYNYNFHFAPGRSHLSTNPAFCCTMGRQTAGWREACNQSTSSFVTSFEAQSSCAHVMNACCTQRRV